MRVTDSTGIPAISVTTSVAPSGVLSTPVHRAAIMAAMATGSLRPGTSWCAICPMAAPMKKSGMMNPPFHSLAMVTVVPASLANTATTRAPIVSLAVSSPPNWASPKVSA